MTTKPDIRPWWKNRNASVQLFRGNCLEVMKSLPRSSVDVVFADPPYFLSEDDGTTCSGGKRVSVVKGTWDESTDLRNIHAFNGQWLRACMRLVRISGTIWCSGTHHNIHSVGVAMRQLGMHVINEVIWEKSNPPPNLSCRSLRHGHESLIWARMSRFASHYFDYDAAVSINGGKQMGDIWRLGRPSKHEMAFGKHATQKPETLISRCLSISVPPGGLVLDPFSGSGTTAAVVASVGDALAWRHIGIEQNEEMLEIARSRVQSHEVCDADSS